MRLQPQLISMGFGIALILVAAAHLSATTLPSVGSSVPVPLVNTPQPVTLNIALYSPSPATVPSSQPVDNQYDFVSNPEINAPSPLSLSPIGPTSYQTQPVSPTSPVSPLFRQSTPVSLLYTGPQGGPSVPGMPSVLNVSTPSAPANDLFSSAAPGTPDITSDFDNSPLQFGPAYVVPEPRLASFLAVAAALALGIVIARRRKREALAALPPLT